jgi:predicted metal-binding protein
LLADSLIKLFAEVEALHQFEVQGMECLEEAWENGC